MKLPVVISGLVVSLALVGCSEQVPAAIVTDEPMAPASASPMPSIAYEDMPPVDESSVTLECASYSESAVPFVRQQADLMVNGVQYRVAAVACGEYASEFGAEVVESFVADNGIWASNGLVSGTDVPFNTSGPCESDNVVVKCPAYVVGEEGEAIGYIEVTGQDNGLVWTFITEEEVAL
jgi:hypothetical protein